jgi:hypothetical protein
LYFSRIDYLWLQLIAQIIDWHVNAPDTAEFMLEIATNAAAAVNCRLDQGSISGTPSCATG